MPSTKRTGQALGLRCAVPASVLPSYPRTSIEVDAKWSGNRHFQALRAAP